MLDAILAPETVHDPATVSGKPGPPADLDIPLTGFPDVPHMVEVVITAGDLVVRYRAAGIHMGAFQGYAPTEKTVTWTGINIHRIECGRIAVIGPRSMPWVASSN